MRAIASSDATDGTIDIDIDLVCMDWCSSDRVLLVFVLVIFDSGYSGARERGWLVLLQGATGSTRRMVVVVVVVAAARVVSISSVIVVAIVEALSLVRMGVVVVVPFAAAMEIGRVRRAVVVAAAVSVLARLSRVAILARLAVFVRAAVLLDSRTSRRPVVGPATAAAAAAWRSRRAAQRAARSVVVRAVGIERWRRHRWATTIERRRMRHARIRRAASNTKGGREEGGGS